MLVVASVVLQVLNISENPAQVNRITIKILSKHTDLIYIKPNNMSVIIYFKMTIHEIIIF